MRRLRFCAALLLWALPALAFADTALYREPSGNVVLRSGKTALRFFTEFGGAPLEWWRQGFPLLTNSHPGSGVSVAWRTGQDPTQASSDGIAKNPIALIRVPSTWGNTYYGQEEIFDTTAGIYQVRGFAPDFWMSREPVDDAVVPNADGSDHGWRLPYAPGRLAATLDLPVRPVIFEGSFANRSGYLFVGDEGNDGSPFADRLREYVDGRVAFKITLSLAAAAPESYAGVVFRASVPKDAASEDEVYRSPALYLLVNRQGVWALVRHNGDGSEVRIDGGYLSLDQRRKLESSLGLQLEVRTHNGIPGRIEVWLDDQFVKVINDGAALHGPHVGLFASSPWGQVYFQSRRIYDVGVEYVARYSPWEEGVVSDVTVRTAPGSDGSRIFDRANLPAVFLNKATFPEVDRRVARVNHANGRYVPVGVADGTYGLPDQFGWWAGQLGGHGGHPGDSRGHHRRWPVVVGVSCAPRPPNTGRGVRADAQPTGRVRHHRGPGDENEDSLGDQSGVAVADLRTPWHARRIRSLNERRVCGPRLDDSEGPRERWKHHLPAGFL